MPDALILEEDLQAVMKKAQVVADRRIVIAQARHPIRTRRFRFGHQRAGRRTEHSAVHGCIKNGGKPPASCGARPIWWRSTCTSVKRSKDTRTPFTNTSRITPNAARRSAKGSFDPVGFSSIAQNPVSVSILSASATATDTGSTGTASDGPSGE
jgi:hypothetical protein